MSVDTEMFMPLPVIQNDKIDTTNVEYGDMEVNPGWQTVGTDIGKKLKILLITPPVGNAPGSVGMRKDDEVNVNATMYNHTGPVMVATQIRKDHGKNIDIQIVDGSFRTRDELKNIIDAATFDVLMLGILSQTAATGMELASYAHEKNPSVHVLLGNDQASFGAENYVERYSKQFTNGIDIVRNDMGHIGASQWIGYLLGAYQKEDIDSLVSLHQGNVVKNAESFLKLNKYGIIPDYMLIPLEERKQCIQNFNQQFGHVYKRPMIPFVMNNKRGCYRVNCRCAYCSIKDLTDNPGKPEDHRQRIDYFRNTVRPWLMEEGVVTEEYGIAPFEVSDTFFDNEKYLTELMKTKPAVVNELIEKGYLDMTVYMNAHHGAKPKKRKMMEELGIGRVNMGLDGPTTELLAVLKSKTLDTIENTDEAVKKIIEEGRWIHASFIFNPYGTTKENVDALVQYIDHLVKSYHVPADGKGGFSAIEVSMLTPLPNSPIRDVLSCKALFGGTAKLSDHEFNMIVEQVQDSFSLHRMFEIMGQSEEMVKNVDQLVTAEGIPGFAKKGVDQRAILKQLHDKYWDGTLGDDLKAVFNRTFSRKNMNNRDTMLRMYDIEQFDIYVLQELRIEETCSVNKGYMLQQLEVIDALLKENNIVIGRNIG